jgi:hypothetical protein
MTQQLLPESPEKTKQKVEGRENKLDSARSFQGGLHPVAQLQRTLGNRDVAKLIQARQLTPGGKITGLQRKLTVGAADDQYEQEADRVARQVMNMPDSEAKASAERASSLAGVQNQTLQNKPLAAIITPNVQRQREKEHEAEEDKDREEEKDESLQAKPFNEPAALSLQRQKATEKNSAEPIQAKSATALSDSFEAGTDVETQLSLSKGCGSPLPDPVRTFMEPRFGVDFSHVRVHTGSDALQMNQAVGAQAFTHGSDIYFGEGHGPTNLELTAHELTHVVQQTGGMPLQANRRAGVFLENADTLSQRACTDCDEGRTEEKGDDSNSVQITPFVQRQMVNNEKVQKQGNTVSPSNQQFRGSDAQAIPCYSAVYNQPLAVQASDTAIIRREEKGVVNASHPNETFSGLVLTDDQDMMRANVRKLFAKEGEAKLGFVMYALGQALFSPKPEDWAFRKQALDRIQAAWDEIKAERDNFLLYFNLMLQVNVRLALELGLLQARKELARYAVQKFRVWEQRNVLGVSLETEATQYTTDPWAGEIGGLRQAAKGLLEKEKWPKFEETAKEYLEGYQEFVLGLDSFMSPNNYRDLMKKLKVAWDNSRAESIREYPVLGALSDFDASKDGLRALAGEKYGSEGAAAIAGAVADVEKNYEKIQAKLTLGQFMPSEGINFWRLDNMVNLTADQLGVANVQLWPRFLADKIADESPGLLDAALDLLVNLGAVALAGITGGASLAISAAWNVGRVAQHVGTEATKDITSGSSLVRSQALSSERGDWQGVYFHAFTLVFEIAPIAAPLAKLGGRLERGLEIVNKVGDIYGVAETASACIDKPGSAECLMGVAGQLPALKPGAHRGKSAPDTPPAHAEAAAPSGASSEHKARGSLEGAAPPSLPKVSSEITAPQAANAVKYVKQHPDLIKGEPGHRHAPVGKDHKIVEEPSPSGIVCILHSPGERRVDCPQPMGTAEPAPGVGRTEPKAGTPSTTPESRPATSDAPHPSHKSEKPAKPVRPQGRPTPRGGTEINFVQPHLEQSYPQGIWEHDPIFDQGHRIPAPPNNIPPKGTTRPDHYNERLKVAVEDKNYNIAEGYQIMIGRIKDQQWGRFVNLPPGTRQWLFIDIRAQHLSLHNELVARLRRDLGGYQIFAEIHLITDQGVMVYR